MTESPYHFFDVHVLRAEYLTPSMIRVALGGEDLERMASAGRDQRIKVFLPHPGQDAPVMPDTTGENAANWYTRLARPGPRRPGHHAHLHHA